MKQTKGLEEYVKSDRYRRALGLPPKMTENYIMLAQGEYNRNYHFKHPITGRELLLRINFGSQMHLEHQIEYEYNGLCLLETSGRTPAPVYVDGSLQDIGYGVMVMEYLPGHALDYRTDLHRAAQCLADIHSTVLPEAHGLILPGNPLRAILEECEEMLRVYMESPLGEEGKKRKIRAMLDTGWDRVKQTTAYEGYRCCVNTELNSTNFLMNESGEGDYIIDWEKPIYGEPAQDLAHFLAPTTTFWKTDVILSEAEMEGFLESYIQVAKERFDTEDIRKRTYLYLPVTCLRGVTWCAMAWVQYQDPEKGIVNASTYRKLGEYLKEDFLDDICKIINHR